MNSEYRNTKAIVIKKTKFKESSAIIQFYTEDFSLVSIIAKGIYRKKNSFFSPCETLSFNNIEYFYKPNREIQTLIKAELLYYPENIIKNYKLFLIVEKIFKVIKFHKFHINTNKEIYKILQDIIMKINNGEDSEKELIRFYINYLTIEGLFDKDGDYEIKKMVVNTFNNSKNQIDKLISILEERIFNN